MALIVPEMDREKLEGVVRIDPGDINGPLPTWGLRGTIIQ